MRKKNKDSTVKEQERANVYSNQLLKAYGSSGSSSKSVYLNQGV